MQPKLLSPAIHFSVDPACAAATRALDALRTGSIPDTARATALDRVAAQLDHDRDMILKLAVQETALTEAELSPEFDRMTGTLRMFAEIIRNGAWRRQATDPAPADPKTSIGPAHDLRSTLIPLGPVAVFGASNFPLAYGVCGGDTASALAAGCPVVVKEHPAHPQTGRLLAAIAGRTLVQAGMPAGMLGYIENADPEDHSTAQELVRHPAIKAVGFTGSTRAGMALDKLARERPDPIPVFAEMGSVNPVILSPGALVSRPEAIGKQLGESILLRFGQQCTCPGLIIFAHEGEGRAAEMQVALEDVFNAAPARRMLAPWIKRSYESRLAAVHSTPGVSVCASGTPAASSDREAQAVLMETRDENYLANPTLREEIFGPAAILVSMVKWSDIQRLVLPGSLTLAIHSDDRYPADAQRVEQVLQLHAHTAGRIIFNGVPTGVRVAESMVHSGPFPACNRPDTTAVGPRAIERWCRPQCWQNALPQLLTSMP